MVTEVPKSNEGRGGGVEALIPHSKDMAGKGPSLSILSCGMGQPRQNCCLNDFLGGIRAY